MEIIGSITGNFLSPQGLDIQGSNLCIADTGNHEIVLYDITSLSTTIPTRLGSMGTDPTNEGFLFPRSVCFISDTELIVADTQNGHLDQYSFTASSWSYQSSFSSFGSVTVDRIVDVFHDSGSSVIILDDVNKQLVQIDLLTGDTNILLNMPTWHRPMSVRVGGGYTWIADADNHCVYRYDSTGTEMIIGSFGLEEGNLSRPLGIALDESSGIIYVAEGDTGRISSFSFNGQFIESLILPLGIVHEVHSIQIDQSGHLWVTDAGANLLYEVDLGSNGPRPILSPSNIDFGSVGFGYRYPFDIKLENVGDADLLIQTINIFGTGFEIGSAISTPQTITPGSNIQFEIVFNPVALGPENGVIEIKSSQEQVSTITANLYGVGVSVEPQALVLIIDRSGSMNQSDGVMSKIERVRHASEMLVSLFIDRPADELGLVTFSSYAVLDRPLAPLPNDIIGTITSLQADGSTSIGAGLQMANLALESTEIQNRNIIVLSDGKENTLPYINDTDVQTAIESSNARVFSVGLGLPENIDVSILTQLASINGGYFLLTDERYYLLPKFFMQIFADATGSQIAVDPILMVDADIENIILVNVAREEKQMTIIATWENYKWQCDIDIETPEGVRVDHNEFTYEYSSNGQRIIKLSTKLPGQWKVCLRGDKRSKAQQVILSVLVDSPIRVKWKTTHIRKKPKNVISPVSGKATGHITNIFPETTIISTIGIVKLGDTLRIEPEFSRNINDVKITGGTVRINPPQWSLHRLRKLTSSVNLDGGDAPAERPTGLSQLLDNFWMWFLVAIFLVITILVGVFWNGIASIVLFGLLMMFFVGLYLKRQFQTTSHEYTWALNSGRAIVDIPIKGLDGVNVITARIEGVRADGSLLQRENVLHVLSE